MKPGSLLERRGLNSANIIVVLAGMEVGSVESLCGLVLCPSTTRAIDPVWLMIGLSSTVREKSLDPFDDFDV
jgi:hypothetical protein